MTETNIEMPKQITPEEAKHWPAICRLLWKVAKEHGVILKCKIDPAHLDGDDIQNLTEIINDAKGRAPEYANILNLLLRIIQS